MTWLSPIGFIGALGCFALTGHWKGALEQRLKRDLGASVGIFGSKEAMRRVMAQVNPAQLPNELIDIQALAQVPAMDGLLNKLFQQGTPFAFHREDLISDRAFDVVEFEQSRGHGAAAREPGALSPAEPVLHQRL
jgi:hypothetical protein